MGGTAVISVRVDRRLKEEAERLGINLRRVVEEALEEAIRRKRMELIAETLEEMRELLGEGVTREEWRRLIREERRRAPGVPA